jgi:hypothetical protein
LQDGELCVEKKGQSTNLDKLSRGGLKPVCTKHFEIGGFFIAQARLDLRAVYFCQNLLTDPFQQRSDPFQQRFRAGWLAIPTA